MRKEALIYIIIFLLLICQVFAALPPPPAIPSMGENQDSQETDTQTDSVETTENQQTNIEEEVPPEPEPPGTSITTSYKEPEESEPTLIEIEGNESDDTLLISLVIVNLTFLAGIILFLFVFVLPKLKSLESYAYYSYEELTKKKEHSEEEKAETLQTVNE